MRGLDLRIHDEPQRASDLPPCLRGGAMDCRVKPGNDNWHAGWTLTWRTP